MSLPNFYTIGTIQNHLLEKNKGNLIGFKFPTQYKESHNHLELICMKCKSSLGFKGSGGILHMDGTYISVQIKKGEGLTNCQLINQSEDSGMIMCGKCGAQLGVYHPQPKKGIEGLNEGSLLGKIFWLDIYNNRRDCPLIALESVDLDNIPFSTNQSMKFAAKSNKEPNSIRFEQIIKRYKEEEEKIKLSDNETYEKFVKESEFLKRKMFKRLHNLKMSDQDLENDEKFNEWIHIYRDKGIPTLYKKFCDLINSEFQSSVRAARKIEEIVKGHVVEQMLFHPSVSKLKNLIESENPQDKINIRSIFHKRVFGKELTNVENFKILPYLSSVCEESYKGKYLCFVDLAKANFTTLKHFDPDIFGGDVNQSWKDYLLKETSFELLHQFHYTVRHPVFGKLNFGFSTHRMIEVAEHELLNVIYNEMDKYITREDSKLLEKICSFKPSQCATDAFFFCCDTFENAKLIYDKLVEFDTHECPHVRDMIHLSIFKNHYYYFDSRWFVVKETLQSQESIEKFTICAVQLEDRPFIRDHFEKALNRISSSNE